MSNKKDKDEVFIDSLSNALAEDVEVDEKEIDEAQRHALEAIKAARREALKKARAERESRGERSIPARIVSMTKEAILARLDELQQAFPGQLALEHRSLKEFSLGDLQSLLADAEYLIKGQSEDSKGE